MKEVRMLRKVYLIPALALFLLPAIARAQFEQGNWELTLAGQGSNDQDFRTYQASVQGSLGYFMTKELELSVRQQIGWADGGSVWSGTTRAALDWHFDLDRLWPFVGVSAGYSYGEEINDDWLAGFELGAKYFLNSTTFVMAVGGYDFALCEGIDNGGFVYSLALGVKF
jgi:hypothetical protein